MIPQYTDHSANERTYLAWLRTSIAIIAFGLLIERFDIFLRSISKAIEREAGISEAVRISPYGKELGAVLAIVGVASMVIATFRFWRTAARIRRPDSVQYDPRPTVVLGGILLLFGLLTLLYVLRTDWS